MLKLSADKHKPDYFISISPSRKETKSISHSLRKRINSHFVFQFLAAFYSCFRIGSFIYQVQYEIQVLYS